MFDHGSDQRIPAGVGERRSRCKDVSLGLGRQIVEPAWKVMQNRPFQVAGWSAVADGIRVLLEREVQVGHANRASPVSVRVRGVERRGRVRGNF